MLKAKYKTGSSCILSNSNDVDYIYYYDTKEERLEALKKNRDHSVNNHYRVWGSEPKVFLGCYIYPFMEHIEGEEIDFNGFSIFNEDVKTQYISLLKRYAERLNKADKNWYHIFIAVKMYEKGGIKLSKKVLETAQNIHDNGIDNDNYQHIIDFLS